MFSSLFFLLFVNRFRVNLDSDLLASSLIRLSRFLNESRWTRVSLVKEYLTQHMIRYILFQSLESSSIKIKKEWNTSIWSNKIFICLNEPIILEFIIRLLVQIISRANFWNVKIMFKGTRIFYLTWNTCTKCHEAMYIPSHSIWAWIF